MECDGKVLNEMELGDTSRINKFYVSVRGNIPPLDATSTTDELCIPIAVALCLVVTLHVQNPHGRDEQGKNQPMRNRPKPYSQGCPGNTFSLTQNWKQRTINVTKNKDRILIKDVISYTLKYRTKEARLISNCNVSA